MSLFRRNTSSKANGKLTRLFFASDFHGSQRIFRKFINAAKHYETHVLVMGGDVVGKLAIPVIREGNGSFRAHLMGKTERRITASAWRRLPITRRGSWVSPLGKRTEAYRVHLKRGQG